MKTFLLSAFALMSLSVTKAQTADEIITKHIDAMGGKDKISQVKSVYIESTTEVMGNQSATKTYILNGKGYRNESDFGGQNLVQVVTDKGGWMINPFAGGTDPVAFSDDQFKSSSDQVYTIDPLVDFTASGGKVELVGQEKVGEVNAYKLKYTNKYNSESTFYVDPSTWYIIQVVKQGEAMGQPVTITTNLSDYQKTDSGILIPNKMHLDMGQFALDVSVNKVEVNKDIDPTIFDMPK